MERPLVIKNKIEFMESTPEGALSPFLERDRIFRIIEDISVKEADALGSYTYQLTDHQFRNFANRYVQRRVKPSNILLFSLLGLIAVAGIHRFYLRQWGRGILYLITGGFFLIGTVLDIIFYQRIARKYNLKVADQVLDELEY